MGTVSRPCHNNGDNTNGGDDGGRAVHRNVSVKLRNVSPRATKSKVGDVANNQSFYSNNNSYSCKARSPFGNSWRGLLGKKAMFASIVILTLSLRWLGIIRSWKRVLTVPTSARATATLLFRPPSRVPTHHACEGYRGILHIQSGDVGGASGTIFFQFVIAQLMWADMYNFKPWVHFNNISFPIYDWKVHGTGPGVNFTMKHGMGVLYRKDQRDHERKAFYPGRPEQVLAQLKPHHYHFVGDGVWEHYFEPVSDFAPGDSSCTKKPYVTLDMPLIVPGLHIYAPWAPRMWRYETLPDYLQKPHLALKKWLDPQRRMAARYVDKYIHFNARMKELARQAHPNHNHSLGLHIRWSDKADGRRQIGVNEFLPYVDALVKSGGKEVYLATDSSKVLEAIEKEWPTYIQQRIRHQPNIVRSTDATAVFKMGFSEHRTNIEVLTDILALSKCTFMIHGLSAVSDTAMYLNPALIDRSVDLEDPEHMTAEDFKLLTSSVIKTGKAPPMPHDWWNPDLNLASIADRKPTNQACEGYNGILHIREGEVDGAVGMTFFHFVLNQLLYAEMHNLKPWIHLSNSTHKVWDPNVHGHGPVVEVTSRQNVVVTVEDGAANTSLCPGAIATAKPSVDSKISVYGTGVWEHYLEQVSDFVVGDESCKSKPFIRLDYNMLVPGIYSHCPWSVRSWLYNEIPDSLGPANGTKYHEWLTPMRQKAHEVVSKYFRFRPHLLQRAESVLFGSRPPTPCLGLHVRLGDKRGVHRSILVVRRFTPFVKAFVESGGQCVYLATDSQSAINYIDNKWASSLKSVLRSQGNSVVRSVRRISVPDMDDDHHRTNSEALVDILALSKCELMIHGFSTVSEAAIYINPKLQDHSVNLEDPNVMSMDQYRTLVTQILMKTK